MQNYRIALYALTRRKKRHLDQPRLAHPWATAAMARISATPQDERGSAGATPGEATYPIRQGRREGMKGMIRIVKGGNSMDCDHALGFIPDLDDWTQRLKETPYDPLEDIRQEHETWLAELEGLAVQAIAIGNWSAVYDHITLNAPESEGT